MTTHTTLRVLYAEDNGVDADLTKTHLELHAPEIELEIEGLIAVGYSLLAIRLGFPLRPLSPQPTTNSQ